MRILVFFILTVLSVSAFSAAIDSPWETAFWESNNPHIFNVFGSSIWDFNGMHPSINSLSISLYDASQITDEKTKGYLFSALEWKNKSDNSFVQCNSILSSVSGAAPSVGSPLFDYKIAQLFAKELFSHSFSECINYGTYWKNTMSNSVLLLSRSYELSDSAWLLAKKDFSELDYLGVCNSDFYGYSSGQCDFIVPAFSGISTGNLSDQNLVAAAVSGLRKSVYTNVPNLSSSGELLDLIWNPDGSLADALFLRSLMLNATQDGFSEYSDLKSALLGVRSSASLSILKLDTQDAHLISAPVKSSIFSESQAYTIAYRLSLLKDTQKKAESFAAQADSFFSFKKQGYLKNTILALRNATELLSGISNDSEILFLDSEKVVFIAREEAQFEISEFESAASGHPVNLAARSAYSSATAAFSAGDSATAATLGKKFVLYDKAASLARIAKNKLSSISAETEANASAEIDSISLLLKNAQKDGINIEYEKAILSSIKTDVLSGADWAVAMLQEIHDSVISKAILRYGPLEQERAELLYQISLGPEFLGDLSFDMASAEQGAFDLSGILIYPDSIGRLAQIESKYSYVSEKIFSSSRKIIEKNLVVSSSENLGPILIDELANATMTVTIHNPTGFSATNIAVPLSPSIDFADATLLFSSTGDSGATLLQKTGNAPELILKNLSPYETSQFVLGKKAVLAFTTKKETMAIAQSDATARVEETIGFNMLANGRFSYESQSVTSTDVYLDGLEFRSGSKLVEKGQHTILVVSSLFRAFSSESGNFSVKQEGTGSEVSYDLSIMPALDIDRATVIVNGNWSDRVKSFIIFAYSGEILENKRELGNGLFGFDILSLKKNKAAKIRVRYSIDNSKDYAAEQLAVLSKLDSTEASQVTSLLAKNNTSSAISILEQKRVSSLLAENSASALSSSVSKLIRDLSSEKDEITEALSGQEAIVLSNSSDAMFLSKLQARESVLGNALSSVSSNSSITSEHASGILSKLGSNWLGKQTSSQFKDAESEFLKLRDRYLLLSNSSASGLPKDFSDFEKYSAAFEGSGSLSDMITLLGALSSVRDVVLKKESETEDARVVLMLEVKSIESSISEILAKYSKEYSEGKSSAFSWAFKVDPLVVQKELAKKHATAQDLREAISSLGSYHEKMNETIIFLSNRAKSEYSQLNSLKSSQSDSWSEQTIKKFNQGMAKAADYLESGDYVKAIKTESALASLVESGSGTDNPQGIVALALSATFIIGVILIYLFRNRGGFGQGIGKGSQEKPQFKKLKSVSYNYGSRQDAKRETRNQSLSYRSDWKAGAGSPEDSSKGNPTCP